MTAIELSNGEVVWLIKHVNAPYPGMIAIADAAVLPSRVQTLLIEALGLDEGDVTWQPSDELKGDGDY